jgi:uncharacterized membrane protein YdjX (TVP38/TMEM64 family)/rhodanese-related sulfurtransferase
MQTSEENGTLARVQTVGRWLLGAVLIAGIVWAILNRGDLRPGVIRELVDGWGIWGPVGFVALYIVAALFFVPGSPLTLAAGAVFGPVGGTIYSLLGATIGASLAFVIARYLAGDWVRDKISGRLETIVDGVEKEGVQFVVYTRLVPLFPFNLLNYAFGLTRIRLSEFAVASLFAMIPGAAAYAYLGHAGQQLAAGTEDAIQTVLLALGALAALALVTTVVRRYREGQPAQIQPDQLREMLEDDRPVEILDVRSPEKFEGPLGHIDGARNIPVGELEQRLEELDGWRERRVVTVGRTDRRSTTAARILQREGFEEVAVLAGGMEAWGE